MKIAKLIKEAIVTNLYMILTIFPHLTINFWKLVI
jgi:uncharacterized membrane protein